MFDFLFRKKGLFKNLNPIELNSNTLVRKTEKFFFEDLKDEFLDSNHNNNLVFTRYCDVCSENEKSFFDDLDYENYVFEVVPKVFGREFSKTCSFNIIKYGERKPGLFEVLNGEGFFLLENNEIADIKIIKVKKGDYVFVPDDYSFVLINSSEENNFSVFGFVSKDCLFEQGIFSNFGGANLFYTTNGFIRNLNSKNMYNLENLEGDFILDYSFDKEKTLYEQVLMLSEKFKFLK